MEKHVILDVLKKSIHNLLQSYDGTDINIIEDSHITQSLCSSIEAMFLQGELSSQTNSIFFKFKRMKQSYEYDFRDFLIEFVPRNLLQVFEHHEFKLTAVGFSRVWLRYSLNESTMLSYLESMIKDKKRLKQFYIKESMIRDEEMMCAFCGLLKSIEHLTFKLDTSLPLLNTWVNSDALQIAGLQHHVFSKSDLDQTENIQAPENIYPVTSYSDDQSLSTVLSNEEEILPTNLLSIRSHNINSVSRNSFIQCSSSIDRDASPAIGLFDAVGSVRSSDIYLVDNETKVNEFSEIENQITIEGIVNENNTVEEIDSYPSNVPEVPSSNLNEIKTEQYVTGESVSELFNEIKNDKLNDDVVDKINEKEDNYIDLPIPIETQEIIEEKAPEDSFDQLWSQFNLNSTISIEEVHVASIEKSPEPCDQIKFDVREIPSEIEPSKVYSSLFLNRMIASTTDLINNISRRTLPFRFFKVKESEDSWVFIGDDLLTKTTDLKTLMDLYPGVSESCSRSGENSVFGGQCHKCHNLLETNKVFFDYYDGQLYCFGCESKTKAVIPRDVISNWDFCPKSVSKTTKQFLSEIIVHPNINLATNSCLFEVVPELTRVRKLRHKLSLLWLQVTSCDIDTSTKVREAMFPREYMLASIKEKDLYSLEDLIMLHNGVLEKTLLYVIDKIAIPHVTKCMFCRMKSLACDSCRDKNNLIYIHEIECYCECSTPLCQSVIHNSCKKPGTKSFYCRRCVQYLENQQPITLASYDTADTID